MSLTKMINIITPGHYFREAGAAGKTGVILQEYGNFKRVLLVAGKTAYSARGAMITASLKEAGIEYAVREYSGYPCDAACNEIAGAAREFKAEALIAAGGGRVTDTVKTAAALAALPVIAVPTIAATCACWAPVAIMYSPDGVYSRYIDHKRAPYIVIADTNVLQAAPERYIHAGIADSLAKWYEVYHSVKKDASLFKKINLSYGNLIKDILEGAVLNNTLNNNFEEVLDCIFLLTGLCGSIITIRNTQGIAHPLYNIISAFPELRKRLHGEKVAFGLIVQGVLEKQCVPEIEHRVKVFRTLDMPLTLKALGFGVDGDINAQVKTAARSLRKVIAERGGETKEAEIEEAIYKASEFGVLNNYTALKSGGQ